MQKRQARRKTRAAAKINRDGGLEKMQKTIVVEVTRKKAHPCARVIASARRFYAHDEKNETHIGDVVRIGRIASVVRLKRWTLERHCPQDGAGRKWQPTSMSWRASRTKGETNMAV